MRLTLAEAHLQCRQISQGKEALRAAHESLLRRVNRIDDPHWRISFVEQVEENARIVRLVTEWAVDGAD